MIAIVAIVIFFYLIVVLSKRSNEDTLVDIDFSKIDEMEGHRFEYFIAKVLRKNGFKNVNVTKASGDYGVDITANKDNQKWAFQCKRYSSNLGLKPIQEIYAGAKKYGADKAVVFTNVYFTPNAQTLAKTLNVELWGRDTLAGMIGKDPETKQSIEADMEEEQTEPEQRQRKIRDNGIPLKLQKNQIPAGDYVVGKDIPVGVYNFKWVFGAGSFQKYKEEGNTTLGACTYFEHVGVQYDYEYSQLINVNCKDGEWIKISGNLVLGIEKSEKPVIDL